MSSDPFSALGIEPRFGVDLGAVRRAWMRRAAAIHPDVAGGVEESALLNAAFREIQDPISRAESILASRGAPAAPAAPLPQAMLLELMDLRERVDSCAGDADQSAEIVAETRGAREASLARIATLLDGPGSESIGAVAESVRGELALVRALDRVLEQLARERGADGGDR